MVAGVEATIAKRPEPFLVALHTLRSGLRTGSFGVEQRLAATEIAADLKLSATPVREALSRLAGEGLVEDRRGQGYFVRRLTGADVADLYRLSLAVMMIAEEPRGLGFSGPSLSAAERQASPVERVEHLFEGWVLQAGGGLLAAAHGRLQARLAPIRRLEPLVIPDLAAEADDLEAAAAGDRPRRQAALRRFHRRRIRLADTLARLAEAPPGRRTIEPI